MSFAISLAGPVGVRAPRASSSASRRRASDRRVRCKRPECPPRARRVFHPSLLHHFSLGRERERDSSPPRHPRPASRRELPRRRTTHISILLLPRVPRSQRPRVRPPRVERRHSSRGGRGRTRPRQGEQVQAPRPVRRKELAPSVLGAGKEPTSPAPPASSSPSNSAPRDAFQGVAKVDPERLGSARVAKRAFAGDVAAVPFRRHRSRKPRRGCVRRRRVRHGSAVPRRVVRRLTGRGHVRGRREGASASSARRPERLKKKSLFRIRRAKSSVPSRAPFSLHSRPSPTVLARENKKVGPRRRRRRGGPPAFLSVSHAASGRARSRRNRSSSSPWSHGRVSRRVAGVVRQGRVEQGRKQAGESSGVHEPTHVSHEAVVRRGGCARESMLSHNLYACHTDPCTNSRRDSSSESGDAQQRGSLVATFGASG